MIIVIILAAIVFTIGMGACGAVKLRDRPYRKNLGISYKEYHALSTAGQRLLDEYRDLPAENRPYNNLPAVVKALDIKHGVEDVNKHYRERDYCYSGYRFVWTHCHYRCGMSEYSDIHKGIVAVQEALTAQKHAMEMAAVQGGLDAVKQITEQLRNEAKLVSQVTKELM